MKKKAFTTFVIAAMITVMSGCATYNVPGGKRVADPKFCHGTDGNALCMLGIGAAVIGAAVLVSK